MANGELCVNCGLQETAHDLYEDGACDLFVSEIAHDEECPVIDCNGDCEETIKRREWRVKCMEHRMSNMMVFTAQGVQFIDIGS